MSRHLLRLLGLGTGLFFSAQILAAAPAKPCTQPSPGPELASIAFANGQVSFHSVKSDAPEKSIDVVLTHPSRTGCARQIIDRYEPEGGEPTLESTFIHPVEGEDNLFTIVSWPLEHAGLDMRGGYYAVHAYMPTTTGLALNPRVADDRALANGVDGHIEGKTEVFRGKTQQGVIELLASAATRGTSRWAAECDPEGPQLALNACAYAELEKAEQTLEERLQELKTLYAHAPDRITQLEHSQHAWDQQLAAELDALFPVGEGEDPRVLYGSSWPMQRAYAITLLTQQRTDFLERFWLPQDAR